MISVGPTKVDLNIHNIAWGEYIPIRLFWSDASG